MTQTTGRIRLLLADHRPFMRLGLRSTLDRLPEVDVVAEVDTWNETQALARRLRPDLLLTNDRIGETDEVTVEEIIAGVLRLGVRVLLLASGTTEAQCNAARDGATGLLHELSDQNLLRSALHLVADGYLLVKAPVETPSAPANGGRIDLLTDREVEVLTLISRGHSNGEISTILALSDNTVKSHVRNLLIKLGLRNRVEAVIYAYDAGLAAKQRMYGLHAGAQTRAGSGRRT